jgi:hypothetical protein
VAPPMRRSFALLLALPLLSLVPLVACATSRPSVAPPAPCPTAAPLSVAAPANADAGAPRFPTVDERRALFADLVAAVRKFHLFSARTQKNLGRRWEEELPALEEAFAKAEDEPSLAEAGNRFGHSLHDGHLRYEPPASVGRGQHLTLGLAMDVEWVSGAPRFYVAEPPPAGTATGVHAGDIVVSAAGVAGEKLLPTYALESSENNWRGIARDVAEYLVSRSTARSATKPGSTDAWVLRHRKGGEVRVDLMWRKEPWPGENEEGGESEEDIVDIDYAPAHCSRDLPDRKYPSSYRLVNHGRFYCLYVSAKAPYSAYPIVRHFSVHYSHLGEMTVYPRYMLPATGWQVSAEYANLSLALRALRGVRGLILDLRDNYGGNDPEWFLDWYAPAPYADMFTSVRVFPEYSDAGFRKHVANVDEDWHRWYVKATGGHAAGDDVPRPFKCMNADCTGDNRFTPAHGLLAVPVALLVGPGCMSSCAHIAHIFDEDDFGPLIGEPTAASYTTQRLAYPLKVASGLDLGAIGLGLSRDSSGKTGEPLEGYQVHIDYPVERTFDGRDTWDAALVDSALKAFREYSFPKRTAKVGP